MGFARSAALIVRLNSSDWYDTPRCSACSESASPIHTDSRHLYSSVWCVSILQ